MPTRAYKVRTVANQQKTQQIFELLHPWRDALTGATSYAYRHFTLQGQPIPKRFSLKTMGLNHTLSARQINSVWVQAYGALSAWETQIQDRFKHYVTRSQLDDFTKVALYRVNQYRVWFSKDFTLPMWSDTQGELTHIKTSESIDWVVPAGMLKLARNIAKQAIKDRPLPDLSKVNTMLMDGTIANREQSNNTQEMWLRIATLTRGKPVLIPLELNNYARNKPGEWNNGVQVTVRGKQIHYTLTKTTPGVEPREEGTEIGLDWGLVNLFTDSRGNQYGQALYGWLKERDLELLTLTRALQSHGVKPSQSKRYQQLNHRIREHVKNEVGRTLNKLAQEDLKLLAVENLNFRHGGLSPRMNRLLTRAGRGAVNSKLKDLEETYGVAISRVNPAYTSQECSVCGFVSKDNRKTQQNFCCITCNSKLHADVNAARNILGRSQNGAAWLHVKRAIIRERLLVRYQRHAAAGTPRTVGLSGNPLKGSPFQLVS